MQIFAGTNACHAVIWRQLANHFSRSSNVSATCSETIRNAPIIHHPRKQENERCGYASCLIWRFPSFAFKKTGINPASQRNSKDLARPLELLNINSYYNTCGCHSQRLNIQLRAPMGFQAVKKLHPSEDTACRLDLDRPSDRFFGGSKWCDDYWGGKNL